MIRLIVMRHAKSAWDTGAADDHSRPLNDRGRKDAPKIAAELVRRGWIPDRVISSDAARTRETWERMAKAFQGNVPVAFTSALYGGSLGAVQEVAQGLGAGVSTLLLLGHNPGFEQVVSWLVGEPVALTTANAALLVHRGSKWEAALADHGGWTLEDVVRPKAL